MHLFLNVIIRGTVAKNRQCQKFTLSNMIFFNFFLSETATFN